MQSMSEIGKSSRVPFLLWIYGLHDDISRVCNGFMVYMMIYQGYVQVIELSSCLLRTMSDC